jgi:hypothetical protein
MKKKKTSHFCIKFRFSNNNEKYIIPSFLHFTCTSGTFYLFRHKLSLDICNKKSTAHGCWTLNFFVSDIKLQVIYKVIHISNYDGHINKYVCKIGKYNQRGIIFSCNTILVHMKKNVGGGGSGWGLYVGGGGLPFCNVFPLLIVNRYAAFHFNAYHSLY